MTLDLVCQVVDNYGDIAVVWRLAQALVQDGGPDLTIRLLVDDWQALAALVPQVEPSVRRQRLEVAGGSVEVLGSTALPVELPPAADVIVEAFGAPTPAGWLEAFFAAAEAGPGRRTILHLEYLTAEPWSEDYHRLPSPVGRPGVDRFFFVPGFRSHAGGLVFTDPAPEPGPRGPEDWLMTLFSYEHDFTNFWTDLAAFLADRDQTARVIVFAGRSRSGALASWGRCQALPGADRITVVDQAFVSQAEYTSLLAAGDFHVVRGEESWVQAVLAGKPFLWHAYLQERNHQLVKVEAFLDVWRPWFEAEGAEGREVFGAWAEEFRRFNRRTENSEASAPEEHYRTFWENADLGTRVGASWASDLRKNAKLSHKMLEFLEKVRV